jgi:hypothetical protein
MAVLPKFRFWAGNLEFDNRGCSKMAGFGTAPLDVLMLFKKGWRVLQIKKRPGDCVKKTLKLAR